MYRVKHGHGRPDAFRGLIRISEAALVLGGWALLMLWLTGKSCGQRDALWRLAYGLTPLAGFSAFLGLSVLTVTMLKAQGLTMAWAAGMRAALLGLALS